MSTNDPPKSHRTGKEKEFEGETAYEYSDGTWRRSNGTVLPGQSPTWAITPARSQEFHLRRKELRDERIQATQQGIADGIVMGVRASKDIVSDIIGMPLEVDDLYSANVALAAVLVKDIILNSNAPAVSRSKTMNMLNDIAGIRIRSQASMPAGAGVQLIISEEVARDMPELLSRATGPKVVN